jgi:hypothetical protein
MFGKDKDAERAAILATLEGHPGIAAQLQADWAAEDAAVQKAYLTTAVGDIPQAKPGKFGPQKFQPTTEPLLSPFITQNPMSLGGNTFVDVNRKLLSGLDEERKRSPWWGLMGYA